MNDIRPDSAPTLQLLKVASSGDRAALGQLLERHLPIVRSTVFRRLDRRLRSRVDPSDVVQETQLQATKRFQEFLSARPMPFHLWLRREAHQQLAIHPARPWDHGGNRMSANPAGQAADRESLLVNLVDEITQRLNLGEPVDIERYTARHPEIRVGDRT